MKNKNKMSVSNKIILTSIIFTTIFTIVAIAIQFLTGQELSATLITCVFAYWGTELINLAMIKRKRIDSGNMEEFYGDEFTEGGE